MIVTRDALAILRLARDGSNLTTGYDAGALRGDEARTALTRRQGDIGYCRRGGWIDLHGRLSASGEIALKRAEETFGSYGGGR